MVNISAESDGSLKELQKLDGVLEVAYADAI